MFKTISINLILFLFAAFSLKAQEGIPEVLDLIEQQAYGKAKARLAMMISESPKDPALHYWLGTVYLEEGDYERARSTFQAGFEVKRNYDLNRVGLSRVLAITGDKAGASALLSKTREDMEMWARENKEVDYAMARAYLDMGAFKEAEILLYKLQGLEGQNPRSYIALGDYYMEKGIGELAMSQYEQAIELDPAFIPGYMRIGKLKIEAKAYEEGARLLTKAIELDPEFAPSYRERGELYFKAKEYERARRDYQRYVELTGHDLAARHRLAEFLYLTENYEATIAELEAIDTTTNVKLRLLAYSYEKTGKPELTLTYLDTYFARMKPEFTIAADYEEYGKALLATGREAKALEYFQESIDRDPGSVVVFRDLARKAKKEKDFVAEVKFRELYLSHKAEKKHNNYYNLGIAQYRIKAYEHAFATFESAAELKPDHIKTYNWLMRIGAKLDGMDTTRMEWQALPAAESVVRLIGDKPEQMLEKGERSTLATATQILAFYHFDPNGDGENNCAAAKPYLERALIWAPDHEALLQMQTYCEAMGGN